MSRFGIEKFRKDGWQEPYESRDSRTESVRDWG